MQMSTCRAERAELHEKMTDFDVVARTQQPENEQNHYKFRCHGIHEFYGWNGNTSVEHSE